VSGGTHDRQRSVAECVLWPQSNCYGAFLATQAVLPAMLEKGSGTILYTGATASLRGAAKFAGLVRQSSLFHACVS
jgi:NADP-dependent 3-hydroxy acid dehydrogenase YdfG